jgi:hypothetical protein
MRLTRAITDIRLNDANSGKMAQLDALADAYLRLCQQYVTAFCADVTPWTPAEATSLGWAQARPADPRRAGCLLLAGVLTLSLRLASQSPGPADVLLSGVWLELPRR